MPEETAPVATPAETPAAPAPASDPAHDGLPTEVRQFLADNPDPPAPDQQPPAAEPEAPADGEAPATDAPKTPAGPTITAEDIAAAVKAGTLSVDDIARIPGVDGKVGQLAQRLVQRQQAEQQAAYAAAQKVEMARSDPDHPLSQIVLGEEQQRQYAEAAGTLESSVLQTQVAGLSVLLNEKLSDAAKAEYQANVQGKQLSVPDLFEQTYQIRFKDDLVKERARWEKEVRPAIEKDIRAQIAEGEPNVQFSNGTPSSSRTMTHAQLETMDWREYQKVQRDVESGRIKLVA